MQRSADISECGAYRWRLDRVWDELAPPMLVCMLNPSTADADRDDPTSNKTTGFGQRWGFGRTILVNLSPYRATKPFDLFAAGFPNPPENARIIREAVRETVAAFGIIVCAWGAHARGRPEPAHFLQSVREEGALPFAFRLLRDGTPEHPLYIPYDAKPVPLLR